MLIILSIYCFKYQQKAFNLKFISLHMPFEDLAYRYTFLIRDFPPKWFPLIQLYDPDIPLFPTQYIHAVPKKICTDHAPRADERIFGFIERINPHNNGLEVTALCNKDLNLPENSLYKAIAQVEVRERLGVNNPVTRMDISNTFNAPLQNRNRLLEALWGRVVTKYFDDKLPFGRLYDKIFGFIRFIASFNSPAGRKSELIQTHYFYTKFGEPIQINLNFPQMVYYLFPTYEELTNNWLEFFPNFNSLSQASDDFHQNYCSVIDIGNDLNFSSFDNPVRGTVNTKKLLDYFNSLQSSSQNPLIEVFNAFDKGPPRTLIFLQMFNDLKHARLGPDRMTSNDFYLVYNKLKGFYQSPKVIALYSQQCFGNMSSLPVDTWVKAFLDCPIETQSVKLKGLDVLHYSNNLGKTERLIWVAAQARKIHSPICNDALWCIKYDSGRTARCANPLSCGACNDSIRSVCPAYSRIQNQTVIFNQRRGLNNFEIWTSNADNITQNQMIRRCAGKGLVGEITDDFTPVDSPNSFRTYPQRGHTDDILTINDFIRLYCI